MRNSGSVTGTVRSLRFTGMASGAVALAAALACASVPAQARPYPHRHMALAQDVGALPAQTVTVTVALQLRDVAGLEQLAASLHDPQSPNYHRFLSSQDFRARYLPTPAVIERVSSHFRAAGLSVAVENGHLLKLTGPSSAIEAAFAVRLRQYEVPGRDGVAGFRFPAPSGAPVIAPAIAGDVAGVIGLDDRPRFAPRSQRAAAVPGLRRVASASAAAAPLHPPGQWTVTDLAHYYNVQPLYDAGLHGEGRTLGIVTLASFTPSDAFAYWQGLGLAVDPQRLKVVDVDGGPGAPSDDAGSDETTLDVEQSGGLAPAARMVVYQAPNTDQAFVDAFAKAVDDNVADSLSVSWGEWEWFDTQSDVTTRRGRQAELLKVFDAVFLRAAVQGQSLFAASGDAGAYDISRAAPPPDYSKTLSVDMPAASPWITAAGGTTLPGTQVYTGADGQPFPVDIANEQAWGWSYLTGLCSSLGYDPIGCGIFAAGSGGGVSSYEKRPAYQRGIAGMRDTEAGQTLTDYTTTPPTDIVDLPAHFAGRNLPDVSLNADPETGYTVVYTSDKTGFGSEDFFGGTSFVAPQLNGIAALLAQKAQGRVGLLNFPLYGLARIAGPRMPKALHDIASGDNWFYQGVAGYEPATGLGTIDVDALATALARPRW